MKKLSLCLLLACLASCAGTRENGDHVTAHAEAFNIFTFPLMGNDYDAAWENVPTGADIISVTSTPRDWTSLQGIFAQIMGVSSTQITYAK